MIGVIIGVSFSNSELYFKYWVLWSLWPSPFSYEFLILFYYNSIIYTFYLGIKSNNYGLTKIQYLDYKL